MSTAFATPLEEPKGLVGNMTNAERVVAFLSANKGNGFCDVCISLATGVEPYDQVNQIVRPLSLTKDYLRRISDCKRCGRTREVTALIAKSLAAKSE
jgi:hypothetical protein